MPCSSVSWLPQLHAVVAAVAFERRRHLLGHQVEKRTSARDGRQDVIDGAERTFGKRDAPTVLPQHVERLRCGHLVDEMQADEQLRLTARQLSHGVRRPRPSETVFSLKCPKQISR
jgi:hypothetical protein